MKNKLYILVVLLAIFTFGCQVDDYSDSNPPRLLDAPAVYGSEISKTVLSGGETTTITLLVSDAPAGIATATVLDKDALGITAGGTFALLSGEGLNSGQVMVEYTAPVGFSGVITLFVSVSDAQLDEKGEDASKSSVPQEMDIEVLCGDLSGAYNVSGTILVDDFGSGPFSYTENLTLESCGVEGSYVISDITGGLYTNDYAENYEVDPAEAIIVIDDANNITWAGVSDQFGEEIVQNPDQPASTYDPATKTFTIYWLATKWGENGITVISM